MRQMLVAVLMLSLLLWIVPEAKATESIALQTGYSCSHCHLDPAGGGELTAEGRAYLQKTLGESPLRETSPARRLFRLLAGYLHILFAVFWFGTILYVHIVLKPAYAAQGLPPGEKRVGVLSFWVVGVTGVILSYYRLSSWSMLYETRFGILLTIKVALYLLMMVSAVFVIKILGPHLKRRQTRAWVPGEPFTLETLRTFDGQEGRPCYFAYQGKVYDASDSRRWPGGQHMKRHAAGADLTAFLALAPHGEEVVARLPVVGEFSAEAIVDQDRVGRQFYFVAYMNLGIVFVILFIIALWRWG